MAEIIHKASVAVFSSTEFDRSGNDASNTVYKCRRAETYRAIFRYSSAKVAKTAEMYVFTRRKYCTKILENIIRDFVLYVFGEDTAVYHCV